MKNNKLVLIYTLAATSVLVGCSKEDAQNVVLESDEKSEAEKIEIDKKNRLMESLSKYKEDESPLYVDGILVVNKNYKLPANFATQLDEEVLNQFNLMKEDAKKQGLDINIRSGFRSTDTQTMLYNNYVAKDGLEKASRYSAKPGHSEHESGLAIDISNGDAVKSIGDWFNETPQAKWLYENAYKYGFILRYPEGKEDITGYKYESWHYRYVGVEHSKNFAQNNLTLEEYLGLI